MSDQERSSSAQKIKTPINKSKTAGAEMNPPTEPEVKKDEISIHDNNEKGSDDEENQNLEKIVKRQNMAVLIASEKELRNFEQVKIKCSQCTGICLKIKNLTDKHMETLLTAIDKDAEDFMKLFNSNSKVTKEETMPQQIGASHANSAVTYNTTTSGIVNLRFEECNFSSRSLSYFRDWMSKKALLETLEIQRIGFQDPIPDFKKLMESIQYNTKIRKVTLSFMQFDEESHGKQISKMLNDSKSMRELDINFCEFIHPKCFFEMCSALLQERCRLNILRLRNIQITNLESKVIQYIFMKNKQITTIDFSNCRVDVPENFEFFLQKLGKESYIRYLTMSGLFGDMSTPFEVLGEALSESTRMEILILNENKIRHTSYIKFWEFLMGNKSIKKISVMKTEISDKTCEFIGPYLSNKWCTLIDLDLSRNLITDVGLITLMSNLIVSSSLLYLNLASNSIRDKGIVKLVEYLVKPKCTLLELSLQGNKINNEGMEILAGFLAKNKSLKMLDLGKNEFSDHGFEPFAAEIAKNTCLTLLDISRNKEINDEGSLVTLVQSIAFNKSIQTLDLTGIRIRKPFLKSHFEPALISNITLKFVNGKMQAEIVQGMLNTNIVIETKVVPNYLPKAKFRKGDFNVKIVDPLNTSFLNMSGCDNCLFQPALKFVKYHDIRTCDFSNMHLQDQSMQLIADYLAKNPNMRSLILDGNEISDYGMQRLAHSLKKNKKLAHISIKNCPQITDEGLKLLNEVISTDNSVLFSIQFDEGQFSFNLSKAVVLESTLNRAIQEHLKPIIVRCALNDGKQPLVSDRSEGRLKDERINTRFLDERKELVFDEHASITSYFESAVKCWRINQPTVIMIENQGLTDEHCMILCNFLKDKNMINELNLRRNKITNKGAIAIADLIVNHDKQITKLDITRNKITDDGAKTILVALKKVVRIRDLQIQYGNHLAPQTAIDLYLEVKANENIQQNFDEAQKFHSSKIRISKIRYELTDKGPDYIRCAIKSVELLNILHMSLPDNMISNNETKMLAYMIQQNPPLVTLNVSNNNLDAECAIILAESLKFNDRLKILNLEKNKLGDKGILELLKPLIKQKFELFSGANKNGAFADNSTVPEDQQDKEEAEEKDNHELKEDDEHKLTGQSKKEDRQVHVQSGLKTINLEKNLGTLESYKSIWLLMKVNANILLTYDNVEQIKERLQAKKQGKDESLDATAEINLTNAALLSDRSKKSDLNSLPMSPKSQNQLLSPKGGQEGTVQSKENTNDDEYDDEADLEEQKFKLEAEQKIAAEEALKQAKIAQKKRIRDMVVKMSCFQDGEEDDEEKQSLSLKEICCWRIYNSRNKAREFWLDDQDPESEIESRSKEVCVTTVILFNEALLYSGLIIPFVLPKIYTSGFIMIGVAGFFIIVEMVLTCLYKKQVDLPNSNCYLFMKTIAGYTSRIMLLALAYYGGLFLLEGEQQSLKKANGAIIGDELEHTFEWRDANHTAASFSIIFLILGQIMPFSRIFKSMTADKNAIRPLRERTRLLAGATYFKGFEAALLKNSLEPSQDSHEQAKEIHQSLLYLETEIEPIHKRFFNMLKTSYNLNHLVLTDIPVICLICAEAIMGVDSTVVTLVLVAIWIMDVLLVIIQILDKEAKVTMQTEILELLQLERQEEFAQQYAELQNIEEVSREVDIADIREDVLSPGSKSKVSAPTENFTEKVENLTDTKKSQSNVRLSSELRIETRKIKTAWEDSNLDGPIKHSDLNPNFNSDHATIEPK